MNPNKPKLSSRLAEIVNAVPLQPGIRILEIGCGPGAGAREIAKQIGEGHMCCLIIEQPSSPTMLQR